MSVETIGIINEIFDLEKIHDFITAKYDVLAKLCRPNKKDGVCDYCTVGFKYNGNDRIMSLGISKSKDYKCIENEYYIWMGLGQGEDAITIVSDILKQYGGYIIENDSIGDEFYVEKNPDETIKKVFRVNMKDVYERFGGIVIISE